MHFTTLVQLHFFLVWSPEHSTFALLLVFEWLLPSEIKIQERFWSPLLLLLTFRSCSPIPAINLCLRSRFDFTLRLLLFSFFLHLLLSFTANSLCHLQINKALIKFASLSVCEASCASHSLKVPGHLINVSVKSVPPSTLSRLLN